MAEEPYTPVSCDYHDQLEAASVTKKDVEIEFDEQGVHQRERGRIADVYSANGQEFVRLENGDGSREVRLDHITNFKEI